MTKEEILAMKPGRELDALIGKEIMGWTPEETEVNMLCSPHHFSWSPSTDISAAWQVWQKVTDQEPFSWAIYSDCEDKVFVEHYPDNYSGALESGCGDFRVRGLFPEVICKAALLSKFDKLKEV